MWNAHRRLSGPEQEDGRAGGEYRVHTPLEGMMVGRTKDARQVSRGCGLRSDHGGERLVSLFCAHVHREYRRPVPDAALESTLDPFKYTHLAPRGQEMRAGDPPSQSFSATGKVQFHVLGVM